MQCKDILQQIENDFPIAKAYEWDNVGLLVGRDDKEIQKVYVALDATEAVIEDAIQWGADLLLTHHPLVFSPLKKINNQNYISNRVIKLIQADISYYAMHTNYDIVRMADLASEKLGLLDATPLEPIESNISEGLGKMGYTSKVGLEEYVNYVKYAFEVPAIIVFDGSAYYEPSQELKEQELQKVAILPGSGKSVIEEAIKQNVEILITGDIGHHEGIDARDRGLTILDAGHYGIEHIFIEDMLEYIKGHFSLDIKGADLQHPYEIL